MAKSTGAPTTSFVVDHTDPGPRPMSEDYEEDNQWLVEAVLAKRRRRGVTQYLVSWKGDWSTEEKTEWVDEDDLGDDLIQELEASGIVLRATPASNGYGLESASPVFDDDDEMDASNDEDVGDDSGSEYEPSDDEGGDKMEMDMDDNADNAGKLCSAELPDDSSVKSDHATSIPEQPDHSSRPSSPVPASEVDDLDEMHNLALVGAALEAPAKADLDALDASWKAHGDTLYFGQSLATMQPATQQLSQAPTMSQTGLAFNPMANTLTHPVEPFRQGPAMMQPVLEQSSRTPMVSQNLFAFDPMLTTEEDAYAAFLAFQGTGEDHYDDSEEDAEGSVISEGEQARYDAMSPWPRM